MSLVAYGSSDEEDENDQEENEEKESTQKVEQQPSNSGNVNLENGSVSEDDPTLFSALPKPRKKLSYLENNHLSKLLLNKNGLLSEKAESVKITVPSVSDFNEDNTPPSKKLKPSVKGTGLLSLLPPPKSEPKIKGSSLRLVPDSVKKVEIKKAVSKTTNVSNKNIIKNSVNKKAEVEDDDDEDVGNSFFGSSLSEPSPVAAVSNVNTTRENSFEAYGAESRSNVENFHDSNAVVHEPQTECEVPQSSYDSNYSYSEATTSEQEIPSNENNTLELDEKALQILCGNKQKRQQIPVNIIDLSGEEIMPDSKEWLLKQLSEEKKVKGHARRKGDGPSTLQRRKHQITYLAYQAKEQELELQNQWANNRMSRRQTQSKYGF